MIIRITAMACIAGVLLTGCSLKDPVMQRLDDSPVFFRSSLGLAAADQYLQDIDAENPSNHTQWLNSDASLARSGNSSVIVAGNYGVFTGSGGSGNFIAALDLQNGQLVWQTYFEIADDYEAGEYGLASSTACYDGDGKIVAFFADGFAHCVDMDGNEIWSQRIAAEPVNSFGLASSPVISGEMVIFQVDLDEDYQTEELKSFIAARALGDGSLLWQTKREVWPSWSTPVVFDDGSKILTTAAPWSVLYEAATGKEIWRCGEIIGDVAAGALLNEEKTVCFVFGDPSGEVMAVNLVGAAGDISDSNILWRFDEDLPDVSTGVYWQGKVYYCGSGFELHCLDAVTGQQLWVSELDEAVYASLIVVGGKICAVDTAGNILLFDSESGEMILSLPLEQEINATPAIYKDSLILRSRESFMRINLLK